MKLERHSTVIAILVVGIIALLVLKYIGRPRIAKHEPTTTSGFEVPSHFERAGPAWAYPDPVRTPGSINPDITQANIDDTICNSRWSTKLIRPPRSFTARLKAAQMVEWGLRGTGSDYEEDHFISLELGGSPTDPRNLWPEPYFPRPGAREKDVVERRLHKQVCNGTITLEQAQRAITSDWYKIYLTVVE